MTTIINLYGGPGTGKSTSAAYIFSKLKDRGVEAELVTEYAKEWAWEGRQPGPFTQVHFLGQQCERETRLYGKVEYIVTDSPLLLSAYYAAMRDSDPEFSVAIQDLVLSIISKAQDAGHEYLEVFLERSKPYHTKGRYETEEQSAVIDTELSVYLLALGVPSQTLSTHLADLDRFVNRLVESRLN